MTLVKRTVVLEPQKFIDDPGLFEFVEKHWRAQNWYALFGEYPVGAVLATQEDGVTFYYMVEETEDDE